MRDRIIVVIPELGFGSTQWTALEVSRMLVSDYDVTLLALTSAPNVYDDPAGVEIVHLPTGTPWRARDRVKRVVALRRMMDQRDPVVILAFTPGPTAMAVLTSRQQRSGVVFVERTDYRFREGLRVVQAVRSFYYRRADRVVVPTHGLAVAAASRTHHQRVVVIPSAVAIEPRTPPDGLVDPAARQVLVVGRFAARDQIEHAVAAFSVALRQNPGWHLKVIGEGQVRRGVESQVAALGLQGSVEVDSSGADVREELASSALVLITGAQEGFPQTLIEAMSCGTVPVAYRRPTAIEEIIDHGRSGWLVPPDDVEALARTTAAAMADHERRAAMSLAAAERSRDFSPEAIAPRWRDVISDLTEAMRYRRRMVARSA